MIPEVRIPQPRKPSVQLLNFPYFPCPTRACWGRQFHFRGRLFLVFPDALPESIPNLEYLGVTHAEYGNIALQSQTLFYKNVNPRFMFLKSPFAIRTRWGREFHCRGPMFFVFLDAIPDSIPNLQYLSVTHSEKKVTAVQSDQYRSVFFFAKKNRYVV